MPITKNKRTADTEQKKNETLPLSKQKKEHTKKESTCPLNNKFRFKNINRHWFVICGIKQKI